MPMEFRPARRSEARPLVGFYAESFAGKTLTSLLLARGFVGPEGRIAMIETEGGRGEAYVDMPADWPAHLSPGPYSVIPLRAGDEGGFSPARYGEAIALAEKNKVDALIIDSASHEWEGTGGVLDMAEKNKAKGDKAVLVWQKPKMDHQRHFMLRFQHTPIPLVILCMRAKFRMVETTKGKWERSQQLDPIQADDILSDLFVHGWISKGDHAFHAGKLTRPDLASVFLEGKPVGIDTGRRLAAWCRAAELPTSHTEGAARADDAVAHARLLGDSAANLGMAALQAHWKNMGPSMQRLVGGAEQLEKWKVLAAQSDKESATAAEADERAGAAGAQP